MAVVLCSIIFRKIQTGIDNTIDKHSGCLQCFAERLSLRIL